MLICECGTKSVRKLSVAREKFSGSFTNNTYAFALRRSRLGGRRRLGGRDGLHCRARRRFFGHCGVRSGLIGHLVSRLGGRSRLRGITTRVACETDGSDENTTTKPTLLTVGGGVAPLPLAGAGAGAPFPL